MQSTSEKFRSDVDEKVLQLRGWWKKLGVIEATPNVLNSGSGGNEGPGKLRVSYKQHSECCGSCLNPTGT